MKLLLLLILFPNIFTYSFNLKPKAVPQQIQTKIPDVKKRQLMNSILLNSIYASCGPMLYGYLSFFYPITNKNGGDGLIAKDRLGDDVGFKNWIENHNYPSRDLVQGLKGDPYYLITTKDNMLEKYAINAICTHLGCVVPWNVAEQKYMCPCHGSQYNSQGKVIRGPAPKSLSLAELETNDNKVILKEWTTTDFRDNSEPWWIN